MVSSIEPHRIAVVVALGVGLLLVLLALVRARRSRYPAVLYTCAGYMVLLHTAWIAGLLSSRYFESGYATLVLLTFPWNMMVMWNMTMAGFGTVHDLLLNYLRFVLGFGGLQCLLLSLFVWELRLRPRGVRVRR